MSIEPYDARAASTACRKACLLYAGLETEAIARGDERSWRCKPKMHMFCELIEYIGPEAGSPRHYWTYQDESWGSWLSKVATKRGGPKFAHSCAMNLLNKYRACATSDVSW